MTQSLGAAHITDYPDSGSSVFENGTDPFSQGRYVCAWNRKSLKPRRTPQSGQHVAERRRGFAAVPGQCAEARRAQVLSSPEVPDHDQRVEPERHGGSTLDSVLGTILGILETELSLGMKERDLQCPALGERFDDGSWLEGGIGGDDDVVLVVSRESADHP